MESASNKSNEWNTVFESGLLTDEQRKDVRDRFTLDNMKAIINSLPVSAIDAMRKDAGCIGLVSCYTKSADQFRTDWKKALENMPNDLDGFNRIEYFEKNAFITALDCRNTEGVQYYFEVNDAKSAMKAGDSLVIIEGPKWFGGAFGQRPDEPSKYAVIVDYKRGEFNYGVYFQYSDVWMDMNHHNQEGGQKANVITRPGGPASPGYRARIYLIVPNK
jgi:hypothetical protein